MLEAVHVSNELGEVLVLPLHEPSRFQVREIEGLGPVKADIITSKYAAMPGGVYQSSNVGERFITFKIGLDPAWETQGDVGKMRRALYRWFSPETKIELVFINDDPDDFETVKTVGYVESCEPTILSEDPELSITINCPDPYLYSLNEITLHPDNEIITVNNPGTAETGFIYTVDGIFSQSTTPRVGLQRVPTPTPSVEILPDHMIYYGNMYVNNRLLTFRMVSIQGKKSAAWMFADDYDETKPFGGRSILGHVDGWLSLKPGVNYFDKITPFPYTGPADISLRYTPRYKGL